MASVAVCLFSLWRNLPTGRHSYRREPSGWRALIVLTYKLIKRRHLKGDAPTVKSVRMPGCPQAGMLSTIARHLILPMAAVDLDIG